MVVVVVVLVLVLVLVLVRYWYWSGIGIGIGCRRSSRSRSCFGNGGASRCRSVSGWLVGGGRVVLMARGGSEVEHMWQREEKVDGAGHAGCTMQIPAVGDRYSCLWMVVVGGAH